MRMSQGMKGESKQDMVSLNDSSASMTHDVDDCAGAFHFQDRLNFEFRMVLIVILHP